MCERNIDWLLLARAATGDQAHTQACAPTGNQLVTFHFAGWYPINWATPVRAVINSILYSPPTWIYNHFWTFHIVEAHQPKRLKLNSTATSGPAVGTVSRLPSFSPSHPHDTSLEQYCRNTRFLQYPWPLPQCAISLLGFKCRPGCFKPICIFRFLG